MEIATIAPCGVACGADDRVAIDAFGQEKERWPRTFLSLPGGIPSHDTFGLVFARLDPDAFPGRYLAWGRAVVGEIGAQVVAVNGKALRGSHDRSAGKETLHLVSAWATASGLVLGQVATDAKSNEIAAIPTLPRLLALEGAMVTIDAMACQTAIASQIVEQVRIVRGLPDGRRPRHGATHCPARRARDRVLRAVLQAPAPGRSRSIRDCLSRQAGSGADSSRSPHACAAMYYVGAIHGGSTALARLDGTMAAAAPGIAALPDRRSPRALRSRGGLSGRVPRHSNRAAERVIHAGQASPRRVPGAS